MLYEFLMKVLECSFSKSIANHSILHTETITIPIYILLYKEIHCVIIYLKTFGQTKIFLFR